MNSKRSTVDQRERAGESERLRLAMGDKNWRAEQLKEKSSEKGWVDLEMKSASRGDRKEMNKFYFLYI